jgi:hypothetical protein
MKFFNKIKIPVVNQYKGCSDRCLKAKNFDDVIQLTEIK